MVIYAVNVFVKRSKQLFDAHFPFIYLTAAFTKRVLAKLTASNGDGDDEFGNSASISGDYALIGAYLDDVGGNGNQGSAYVFHRSGVVWNQQAMLIESDGSPQDEFGQSVSIDGDYVLIGAYKQAAYVFLRSGTAWNQQAKLVASDGAAGERFGWSVSISGDYAVIGANYDDIGDNTSQGSAYIFLRSGTLWSEQAKLIASDGAYNDQFGTSASINGDYALVGSPYHDSSITGQGSAYVYLRSGTDWNQQAQLIASDGSSGDTFGGSVSIDGDYALIGAYNDVVAGIDSQGSAYIFLRSGTLWSQEAKLIASDGAANNNFGYSVSIDGDYALVGAYADDSTNVDQGSAYIFLRSATTWSQQAKVVASDGDTSDQFGRSASLSGDYAVIGAFHDDIDANVNQGSAHTFQRYNASWLPDCAAGAYLFNSTCVLCETGRYNDQPGESSCFDCPSGTYNPDTGADALSYCIECIAGKYNPNVASSSISVCLDCAIGTYNPDSGQAACTECSIGKYNPASGSDSTDDCIVCEIGKYNAYTGQTTCLDCAEDYFQSNTGQPSCTACFEGTCTNGLTGQESCASCSSLFEIYNVSGCEYSANLPFGTVNCPTTGAIVISVQLSNASSDTTFAVRIDGSDCGLPLFENGVINCTLPSGVGTEVSVEVEDVNLNIARSSNLLSYIQPYLTSVHGCDDFEALPHPNGTSSCSRDGLDEVTVSGNSFGPDQASVLIGGVKAVLIPLSDRNMSGWEQNTTIIRVPPGSGLGVGVNVLQKGGELSDGVRMLSYKSCDPGFYNLRNDLNGIYDCAECALGYYNVANESFSCELCPSGSYCSSSNITSCDLILSGSSSPSGSTGSNNCTCENPFVEYGGSCVCPPGEGYLGSSDTCVACVVGEYKSGWDLNSCLACSDAHMTSLSGSTNESSCVCENPFVEYGGSCVCPPGEGYLGSSDTCVACVVGEYKSGWDLNSCLACSDPFSTTLSVSSINESSCICKMEYLDADSSDLANNCIECPSGMICDEEGSILTSISLESGYWRESSTDLSTRECPYESACTGSSDTSNQCIDGHSGPLCAVCEDGYTSANANSKCFTCYRPNHLTYFIAIFILLFLCLLVCLARAFNVDFGWLKKFIDILSKFNDTSSVRVRIKVTLAYLQIIGAFQSVLTATLPKSYVQFLTISQSSSLSFGSIFSPRCIDGEYDFYDELLARTISPIIVGLLIVIVHLVKYFKTDSDPQLVIIDFWSWIFLFSFLFFPSASTAVFQTFNCDDDFDSGSSYLKTDYRLECDGSEYEKYRSYALLMMLVYPIGIPLFYFSILFSIHKKLNASPQSLVESLKNDENSLIIGGLRRCLKDYTDTSGMVNQGSRDNQLAAFRFKREVGRRLLIEHAGQLVAVQYAPLFEAYRPEVWYFECVECLRRLSLTGLLVFLYPGEKKQVWLAMIICMFWIILYTWHKPYLNPSHNSFMVAAQWGILLQLFGVLFIVEKIFEKEGGIIGVVLIIIGITVIFAPLIRSPDVVRLVQDIIKVIRGVKSHGVSALDQAMRLESMDDDVEIIGEVV